ncbi:MAG: hypothetical protein N2C14_21400 [Planctomycetales bacterium]
MVNLRFQTDFKDPDSCREELELGIFGSSPTEREYARLSGIPLIPNATIGLRFGFESNAPGFPVGIRGVAPDVAVTRLFFAEEVVNLTSIKVAPLLHNRGVGRGVFAAIAKSAAAWGFKRITAKAMRAGDARMGFQNGYYSLARWGFNAPLSQEVVSRMPRKTNQAETLHDLMTIPSGRRHWKRHGETIDVEFDLDPESRCWSFLREEYQFSPALAMAGESGDEQAAISAAQ